MTIEQIKKEMLAFEDFYGGDFLDDSQIKKARSKKQLAKVIERHRSHMEDMLSDAFRHLDDFKTKMGLNYL